jgi:hypothetical protein
MVRFSGEVRAKAGSDVLSLSVQPVIVRLYSALNMATSTHQVDLVCEPSGVPGSSVGRAIDSYTRVC